MFRHGHSKTGFLWDEADPHMTALHLRKSTGAKSIRLYRIRPAGTQLVSVKVVMLQI
jgi:hypothetical protein